MYKVDFNYNFYRVAIAHIYHVFQVIYVVWTRTFLKGHDILSIS